MTPFTAITLGVLLTLGLGALGLAFWISRPQRRRKWRDRDEHADGIW